MPNLNELKDSISLSKCKLEDFNDRIDERETDMVSLYNFLASLMLSCVILAEKVEELEHKTELLKVMESK